jgi:hypothetical protein
MVLARLAGTNLAPSREKTGDQQALVADNGICEWFYPSCSSRFVLPTPTTAPAGSTVLSSRGQPHLGRRISSR